MPSHISASLTNVAQLLVVAAKYLSVRLPAEIVLPQRNHPAPTIYTPAASYVAHSSRDAHANSSSSSASSTTSPPLFYQPSATTPTTISRTPRFLPHYHRPRPLVVDKNLPKLAREDPAGYALFLEGATLLAWNVSWLCRTQGLDLTSESWEDVCDIGKNMWRLLVAPPTPVPTTLGLTRASTGRDVRTRGKTSRDNTRTTVQRTKSSPTLGHFSHGTVHSFLGASDGTEFMRSWKLPTPTRIIDKLRVSLLGEMASAEWEFLDKKEWDDESHESRVVVRNPSSDRFQGNVFRPMGPVQSTSEQSHAVTNEPSATGRPRGVNVWTRLKSRPENG